jgi:biopolymer transport protein ExbD
MNFYTRRRPKPVLQIISMIDLLIVLLIFLVVTTTFKEATSNIKVALPQSSLGKGESAPGSRILLSVTPDAKMFLGEAEVTLADLPAALRQQRTQQPGAKIAIRMDKDVKVGLWMNVADAMKAAGLKVGDYSMLTKP